MFHVNNELDEEKCPADRNRDRKVDQKEWRAYWLRTAKRYGASTYVRFPLSASSLPVILTFRQTTTLVVRSFITILTWLMRRWPMLSKRTT